MPVLKRVVKPTTQRGKRALIKKEPKLIENDKTPIFIKGSKTSLNSLQCLKDLASLKRPEGVLLSKRNDVRPFEDATKIEKLTAKYDASLFAFASHNKKRPNNIVIGRMYDQQMLDMIEMGIESYNSLQQFKVEKIACGTKPIIIFAGEAFERQHEYQRLKCLLLDFFRGPQVSAVRLVGLEHVLLFTVVDSKIHMKSYRLLMKKSGSSTPRVELEEIGPSVQFSLRRFKLASDDLYKLAKKTPIQLKKKKVKNISRDPFGSRLGRVHMQKQNLKRLQTRKMKGLKKNPKEKMKKSPSEKAQILKKDPKEKMEGSNRSPKERMKNFKNSPKGKPNSLKNSPKRKFQGSKKGPKDKLKGVKKSPKEKFQGSKKSPKLKRKRLSAN